MAEFQTGYKLTVFGNEGGYNPGVGENQTYEGIDRGMNPHWSGWAIIDAILKDYQNATIHTINEVLAANEPLQAAIQAFYKANYWDDLNLSEINDQQVANNAFDASVNPCIISAGRVLQEAVNNVLLANGQIYNGIVIHPLIVDGLIGHTFSIPAINRLPPKLLFNAMNDIRRANYIKRGQLTPKDAQWVPIWLRRLVAYVG